MDELCPRSVCEHKFMDSLAILLHDTGHIELPWYAAPKIQNIVNDGNPMISSASVYLQIAIFS